MLFHRGSELAIRATVFLSLQPPGKLSPVHEIADATGASQAYLAKILQRLSLAGLIRAFRGPGRGMELGHAPEKISLGAVVEAMEGPPGPEWCVLGSKFCSGDDPCPLHDRWVPLRTEIQRLLDETTVASLAQRLRTGAPREYPVTSAAERPRGSATGSPTSSKHLAQLVPPMQKHAGNKRRAK